MATKKRTPRKFCKWCGKAVKSGTWHQCDKAYKKAKKGKRYV